MEKSQYTWLLEVAWCWNSKKNKYLRYNYPDYLLYLRSTSEISVNLNDTNMGSFLEEILRNDITESASETAQTNLQDSKFLQMQDKTEVNLGGTAKGVLNVIRLADKSIDKTFKIESTEE